MTHSSQNILNHRSERRAVFLFYTRPLLCRWQTAFPPAALVCDVLLNHPQAQTAECTVCEVKYNTLWLCLALSHYAHCLWWAPVVSIPPLSLDMKLMGLCFQKCSHGSYIECDTQILLNIKKTNTISSWKVQFVSFLCCRMWFPVWAGWRLQWLGIGKWCDRLVGMLTSAKRIISSNVLDYLRQCELFSPLSSV